MSAKGNDRPLVARGEPMPIDPLSLLYHPYFEPDLATLRRALLVTDAVRTIVPEKANFQPSMAVFKHMEALPGTFVPTSPEADDLEITKDYHVLDALRKAFAQLSNDDQAKKLHANYSQLDDGATDEIAISGFALLSAFKVTFIIYQMLREHDLIFEERDDGNFLMDERAANLIVSFLAQRMSYRLAVRTLTGVEDSYLLSTACDVYDACEPDKEAMFASAILNLHIPDEIGEIDSGSYTELRARYSDLRQSFPLYLEQLQQLYRVKDIKTAEAMRAALRDIEAKFSADMERIKTSKLGQAVRKWGVIGIGGALSVGAAYFPSVAVPMAAGIVGVQALAEFKNKPVLGHFDGVRTMMMSARNDVLRANRLPNFLSEGLLDRLRGVD
ncbi:MAG TPA: hypothetical protein VFI23_14745 [Rhizomicrobium sp.]|nr:hypothetical protein [Rhizomicrobium sp.]